MSSDGDHLVGLALVDELEPEVLRADGDGGGFALGDKADAQAAEASEGDAEAVVGGEAFDFEAGVFAVGRGLPAFSGRKKSWPSVRTPSTSKMRTLMRRARSSADKVILR